MTGGHIGEDREGEGRELEGCLFMQMTCLVSSEGLLAIGGCGWGKGMDLEGKRCAIIFHF